MLDKQHNLKVIHTLYVEDHADTQEMIKVFLAIYGYSVVSAYSIADGLALAKSGSFDLYILDSWLPDGDGLDLCKQIRTFDRDTPIIFISGVVFPSEIDKTIAAGAQAYLKKPIELSNLYYTLLQFTELVGATN